MRVQSSCSQLSLLLCLLARWKRYWDSLEQLDQLRSVSSCPVCSVGITSYPLVIEAILTLSSSCAVLSLFKHSTDPKDKKLRLLAWILLIWGFVVMILSLSMNICEHSFALLLIVRKTDSNRSNIDHLTQKPEGPDSLHTLGLLGGKSSHPAANSILRPTTELPIDG